MQVLNSIQMSTVIVEGGWRPVGDVTSERHRNGLGMARLL